MSRLSNLLRQVETQDPQLAADLKREMEALSGRRAFGLNFERHIPETVELPDRPVRRGDKVRFLPERGEKPSSVDRRLWRVGRICRTDEGRVADLVRQQAQEAEHQTASRAVDDLVVVAEFRDPIYPGLVSTGKVERGGDRPFHTVINAENFHALQVLLYTHEGKIDAIYIDPPYNTGARDWKYNNDYIAADDSYRHSKWLAFMERRLLIARRLLNPVKSVLIVTIDEKEYLRLGLLLEQLFAGCRIQMVSSVINPKGSPRRGEFSRAEEYLFFVYIGDARVIQSADDMLHNEGAQRREVRWAGLRRNGANGRRTARPNLFYPIFFRKSNGLLHSIGDSLPRNAKHTEVKSPRGTLSVFPLGDKGQEMTWGLQPQTLRAHHAEGYIRYGQLDASRNQQVGIYYLPSGPIADIASGAIVVTGRETTGAVIVEYKETRSLRPMTVWNRTSHSAGDHGASLLSSFVPNSRFPFPKSLYAVEDALRFFIKDNPAAIVLDFFGGSGTTSHAVMRLNKQDNGWRKCILVTNNEVSADEQAGLRKQGLRPGDPDWEALGVCEYLTKPRIAAAVTGKTTDGSQIEGDYKFTDEFPMAEGFEENVEFFTMTYEAPRPVAHNRAFEAIAPLLWLRAGSRGRRIEKARHNFDVADTYAVLFDLDASQDFLAAVAEAESVRIAFIVTDDDRGFQMVCGELPARVKAVRLYESYLTNFTINTGRE